MHSGELVYDADCAFCTRFAHWVGPAQPREGITAAGWLVGGEVVAWGAPAIASALVARGGWAVPVGRTLRLPVVRLAADLVYRWVAANRHLMPGGTNACKVERSGPSRVLTGSAMVLILVVALASFAASWEGREAYPSLQMPAFRGAPQAGGQIITPEVTYTLIEDDGSERPIPARDVLGEHSGYIATRTTLSTGGPMVAAWVRSNLGAKAVGATAVRVDWHRIAYDLDSRDRHDRGVVRSLTLDLRSTS